MFGDFGYLLLWFSMVLWSFVSRPLGNTYRQYRLRLHDEYLTTTPVADKQSGLHDSRDLEPLLCEFPDASNLTSLHSYNDFLQ